MKKLILLTVVLVLALTASIQAAPRGMEWGWSMADVESVERDNGSTHVETDENSIMYMVHDHQETVGVLYMFNDGLETVLKLVRGDSFQNKLYVFMDLVEDANSKFGEPDETDYEWVGTPRSDITAGEAMARGYLDLGLIWRTEEHQVGIGAFASDDEVMAIYTQTDELEGF